MQKLTSPGAKSQDAAREGLLRINAAAANGIAEEGEKEEGSKLKLREEDRISFSYFIM